MKRTGYIYEKIIDIDNIKNAIMKASLGKRNKAYVLMVLSNINYYALEIREMLVRYMYIPSPYTIVTMLDGANKKERTISKPRFYPDQIIHWALMLQLQPIIMKGMYGYTCGSVPGRGTSYGQKTLRRWIDTDRNNTKYCLKMDISKYYPSINNIILKSLFRKDIKDKDCLWLIDLIIDSADGLPIGNYTSQWFANYYLQELDHFIKQTLKVKYYIRYVDDLVILDGNKRFLHRIRKDVEIFLKSLKLTLKNNWQVFQVDHRAIDFLGFKFYRDKTILRKRNSLRIRRRIRKIWVKKKLTYKDASAIVSYWGWIKRSNSFQFYSKYIKPMINIKKAKKVISWYGRKKRHLCIDTGVRPVKSIHSAITTRGPNRSYIHGGRNKNYGIRRATIG